MAASEGIDVIATSLESESVQATMEVTGVCTLLIGEIVSVS